MLILDSDCICIGLLKKKLLISFHLESGHQHSAQFNYSKPVIIWTFSACYHIISIKELVFILMYPVTTMVSLYAWP